MKREDKIMREHLEETVKMLAMERAMLIKTDVMTEEEVTEFINEAGEKYAKKYDEMNPFEIVIEKMMEIIKKVEEENNGK